MAALGHHLQGRGHVVAQIVEAELGVGAVGDVALVRFGARIGEPGVFVARVFVLVVGVVDKGARRLRRFQGEWP